MAIVEALTDQYERGWRMVEATVAAIPDARWREAGRDYLNPARLAYHLVETVEFYFSDSDDFPFGQRFGGDWPKLAPAELPSRDDVRDYLREVREKSTRWIRRHDDVSILGPNRRHPWCGETLLGLALYVLRHTLHHHGEMNALAVLDGSDTDNWE